MCNPSIDIYNKSYIIILSNDGGKTNEKDICKEQKELEATVKELRNNGYMLITLGKCFAELENDNEIVVVDKARA